MPGLFNQFTLNRIFFSFFLFSFLSSAVFTLIFIDTTNELIDSTWGLYSYASGTSSGGSARHGRRGNDHEVVGNVVYSKLPSYRRYSSSVDTAVHGDDKTSHNASSGSNATSNESASHVAADTVAEPPTGLGLARILLHTAEHDLERDAKALNISWQKVDRSSHQKQRRQQYTHSDYERDSADEEQKEPLLYNKLNKEFTDAYLLTLPASNHYIPTVLNADLIESIVNNEVQPHAPTTLLLTAVHKYLKTDSTSSYVPQYASRLTRYIRTDGHNFYHTATQYTNTQARIDDYLNNLHVEDDDSYFTNGDDGVFDTLFAPENWMLSEYMGDSASEHTMNSLYNAPYEVRNTDWLEVHSELIPGVTTHTAVTGDHDWIAVVYNRHTDTDKHAPPSKPVLRVYYVNTSRILDEREADGYVNEDLFSVDIKLPDNSHVTAIDIASTSDDSLSASVTLGYANDLRPFHTFVVTATPSVEDQLHYSLRQSEQLAAPVSDTRAPLSETLLLQSYSVPPSISATNVTVSNSTRQEHILQRALIVESSRTPTSTCAQYSVSMWHRDAAGWYQSEEMKLLARKLNLQSRTQQKLANPHVQYLPSADEQGVTSHTPSQRYQHQQMYNLRNKLISSSSANQIFSAICHLPYVAAIDPSTQAQPIEITNLHASTIFNSIAINNYGDLIAIHEHHANIILLQRQQQPASSTASDASTASSLHWLGNSKWEVISEIQFPDELKMYDLLQMQFVDVNHVYHTQKPAQIRPNETANNQTAAPPATSPIIQSNTYLTVLLQHGILMSYDIVTKSTTILPTASGDTQLSAPIKHRSQELGVLADLLGADSDDWYTLLLMLCTRFEFICGVLTMLFFTLPILQQFVTQLFLRHFMPRITVIDPVELNRAHLAATQPAPAPGAPSTDDVAAPFTVPQSEPLI